MLAQRFLADARQIVSEGSLARQVAPRVVSICYYATFHKCSEAAVDLLVGPHAHSQLRARRSLTHKGMFSKSKAFSESIDIDSGDAKKVEGFLKQHKWCSSFPGEDEQIVGRALRGGLQGANRSGLSRPSELCVG